MRYLLLILLSGCSSFTADRSATQRADIDFLCEGKEVKCHFKAGRAADDSTKESGQETKAPAGVF